MARSFFRQVLRKPYKPECPRALVHGERIRMLSDGEIAEFQAKVESCMRHEQNEHVALPDPPAKPMFPGRTMMVVRSSGRDWPLHK